MKRQLVSVYMVALALMMAVSVAFAATPKIATGDSRNINSQPAVPSTCETLSAAGTTSSGSDQTSAITSALSSCAGKGAVVLQSSGSNNAFWAKSFSMSSNEVLVINSGVYLEASSYSGGQFIEPSGSNISIFGPGTIDGRSSSGNRLINAKNITNFNVVNIHLQNAGKMQLYVEGGSGFTAWAVTLLTKANTANTDGIDIDSLTNATVADSTINSGDDCIAVKTNSAAVSNVTVKSTKCRGGHGLSIGSQTFDGVSNILFENNYAYDTDQWGNASTDANGINIKTDPSCGGHVDTVEYLNTCMTGLKHLIIMNTKYGSCSGTSGTPLFTNIVVNGAYSTASQSGAYYELYGYNSSNIMTVWLENVSLDATKDDGSQDANVGLYNSNITPSGTDVTTYSYSGSGSVPSCSF